MSFFGSKPKTEYIVPDQAQDQYDFLNWLQGAGREIYNNNPHQAYEGDRVAEFDPMQERGIESFEGAWGNIDGMANSGLGWYNNLMGNTQGALQSGRNILEGVGNTEDPNVDRSLYKFDEGLRDTLLNNPYIEETVDALTRDDTREFSEHTIPGMDQSAAMTGTMGGTRGAIASAIAEGRLKDRRGIY